MELSAHIQEGQNVTENRLEQNQTGFLDTNLQKEGFNSTIHIQRLNYL